MDNLGTVLKDSKLSHELLSELTTRRNSTSLSNKVREILIDFNPEKFHAWIKRQTHPFMSNRAQNLTQDQASKNVGVRKSEVENELTTTTAIPVEHIIKEDFSTDKKGKYMDILMKNSNGHAGETSQGFGSAFCTSSQESTAGITNGTTTSTNGVNNISTLNVKTKKKAPLSTKVKKRVAPTTITPVTTAGMEIDGQVVTGNILTLPDSDVSTMRECISDANSVNSISSTPPSSVNASIDFGHGNKKMNLIDTSMESGISTASTMTIGGNKDQNELVLIPRYSKQGRDKDYKDDTDYDDNARTDKPTILNDEGSDSQLQMSKRVYDSEDSDAVKRLSKLYACIVHRQQIAIVDALTLLSKLVCISRPASGYTVALLATANPNSIKRSKKKNSNNINGEKPLLVTLHMVHIFAAKALEYLQPFLKLLGGHFLDALSDCSVLREYHPSLASALQSIAVGLRGNDDHFTLPDVFIRPFREEIDSRLEYKTAIESQIYNERERCFDEFSNLFHSYQEANRSDISGVKVGAVFRSIPVRGAKVLNLKDCNIHWFADLFVKMLLFYGSNATTNKKASPPSNANKTSKIDHDNQDSSQNDDNGSSVISYEKNGTVYYSNPNTASTNSKKSMYTASSTIKQRKLEERLGVGGHMQVGYRGNHFGSSKSNASNSDVDLFEEPALYFPGAQQFFFRFIVMLDSHRFTECLESVLCAEIVTLVEGNSSRQGMTAQRRNSKSGSSSNNGNSTNNTSLSTLTRPIEYTDDDMEDEGNLAIIPSSSSASLSEPFSQRTLKLKILGKFLGLVKFWPHWTLSMSPMGGNKGSMGGSKDTKDSKSKSSNGIGSASSGGKAGPVSLLIEEGAVNRMMMKTSLPIRSLLEKAWTQGNTCLVAAWTTEFLKMSKWDGAILKYNCYEDALYTLKSIQYSSLFHPISGMLTSNRLHTLLDIQSLWYMLPAPIVHKLMDSSNDNNGTNGALKLPSSTSNNTNGIRLDDLNQAFTPTFNHYVAPFLEEIITSMRLKGKSQRRIEFAKGHKKTATSSDGSSIRDVNYSNEDIDSNTVGRVRSTTKINRVTPTVISSLQLMPKIGSEKQGGQAVGSVITVSESSSFHSIASTQSSQNNTNGTTNGVTTIGFGSNDASDTNTNSHGITGNDSNHGANTLFHRRSDSLGDLSMSVQHDLAKRAKKKGELFVGDENEEGEIGLDQNSVNMTLTSTSLQLNQVQQQLRFGSPTNVPRSVSPRTCKSPIEASGPPGLRPLTPLGRAMSIVTTHSSHKTTYAPGSISSTTSASSLGNKSFFSLERSTSFGGSSDNLRDRQLSSVSPLSFSHGRSNSRGGEGGSGKGGVEMGDYGNEDDFANRWSWAHDQGAGDRSPIKAPLARRERRESDESGGKEHDLNDKDESESEMRRKYSLSPTTIDRSITTDTTVGDRYSFSSDSMMYIKDELETAFWQQHPQLLYMGSFIIEHCHAACHAHLKERVAAAVRVYFEMAINIRDRLDGALDGRMKAHSDFKALSLLQSTLNDGNSTDDVVVKSSPSKRTYKETLSALVGQLSQTQETHFKEEMLTAMKTLHATTILEGTTFVKAFLPEKLGLDTLSKMCSLYPGHERIQHVAIQLIQKQSLQQSYVLVDFLNAYAKRKLKDVIDLSMQQFKKHIKELCTFKVRQSLTARAANATTTISISSNTSASRESQSGLQGENKDVMPSRVLISLPSYEDTVQHIKYVLHSLSSYFHYSDEGVTGENNGSILLSDEGAMELFLWGSNGYTLTVLPMDKETLQYTYSSRDYRIYTAQLSYCMEQMVSLLATLGAIVTQSNLVENSVHTVADDSDGSVRERQTKFLHCISSFLQLQAAHLAWDTLQRTLLGIQGGRFKIETAKHLILTLPSLLYLDVLLVDILGNKTKDTTLPSDFLLSVYDAGGLRQSSLIRCILSTARKATLGYYTSCVGYHQLRRYANKALLSLLYRCITWNNNEQDSKSEKKSLEQWCDSSEGT